MILFGAVLRINLCYYRLKLCTILRPSVPTAFQPIDIMPTMHTMQQKEFKSGDRVCFIILACYVVDFLKDGLLWEQEVPSSNLDAPTKFLLMMLGCTEF
jgi:hypothetical protein